MAEQTQPPTENPEDLEVPLEDIDALLKQEDPEFESSLKEIGAVEVAEVDLGDESIDETMLDSGEALTADLTLDEPGLRGRLRKLRRRVRDRIRSIHYAWVEFRQGGWKSLVKILKILLAAAQVAGKKSLEVLKSLAHFVASLDWRGKLVFVIGLLLFAGALMTMRYALKGGKIHLPTDRYTNLGTVADHAEEFEPTEGFLDFYASANQPQFFVALEKIVVNLKASASSTPNPMGAFKFMIEGSTQELAVEIKDREMEVRDLIQRSLEDMTYDQLSTPEGKQYAKVNLRQSLNKIFSQGRVRRVLIDSVILKP